ncbi:uncharacterized protein PG986_013255 [Apiospora aurea]|uniref:Uncharacterized protein n=1 Tax=Apiospora aurea TaxID=335848 RepID=A0ABR1PVC4_9PEZI
MRHISRIYVASGGGSSWATRATRGVSTPGRRTPQGRGHQDRQDRQDHRDHRDHPLDEHPRVKHLQGLGHPALRRQILRRSRSHRLAMG